MSDITYACPVCDREVARTKRGIRDHVGRKHPDLEWTEDMELSLRSFAVLNELLDLALDRLNDEYFTWLYMAVRRSNRGREERARRYEPWPAGPGDGRRDPFTPPPEYELAGTARIEFESAGWPLGVQRARIQVLDEDGELLVEDVLEGFTDGAPWPAVKAAMMAKDLMLHMLTTPVRHLRPEARPDW